MKNALKKLLFIGLPIVVIAWGAHAKLKPVREYMKWPPYTGQASFDWKQSSEDTSKKTVLIMADNDMTELFDLLTPFYLFSETEKANVFIVAQNKYPVLTQNGPFILPHFTYGEIDSAGIIPDAIVIPYMNNPESFEKTDWLKKHTTDSTILLSICDGAWTAAASGLYDGEPMTSHATGHDKLKLKYPKPSWIQDVNYTQSGNLYSTGGVSNATNGSLAVIERMLGHAVSIDVAGTINFRSDLREHISTSLTKTAILEGLKKVFFQKNKTIGVLLQNGVSEMELGAIFDVYARTMPSAILTIIQGDNSITTKHGLTVLSIDKIEPEDIDELHVLGENGSEYSAFKNAEVITYLDQENYILETYLNAIQKDYGTGFQNFVKLTLDYN